MASTYGTFPVHGSAPACATGAEGQERRGRPASRWRGKRRAAGPSLRPTSCSATGAASPARSGASTSTARAKPGRHRYEVVAVDAKGRRGRPSKIVRARVPKRASPLRLARARRPGSAAAPAAQPSAARSPAAMVDRLFWRAGFGPTQAQRDAWVGKRPARASSTGSWTRRRRSTPTSTPPLTGAPASRRSTRWPPRTSWCMEWLDRMQRAVNPLPERLAFFWHRHWAVSRDDGIPVSVAASPTATACSSLDFGRPGAQLPAARVRDDDHRRRDVDVPERQRRTSKTKPNENYARELMELFCLGPNAPDGSAELHAGRRRGPHARAHRLAAELRPDDGEPRTTARSRSRPSQFEPAQDVPRPHASRRSAAPPTPRDGPAAVNAALDIVLGHPSHAQFLIRKLWSEFIASPIPQATLDELIAAYRGRLPAAAR